MVNSHPRRVISVGGGKGGVGKSLVAANLAVAMAQTGARVVLVDADLGAPNQHVLFGITRPGPGLEAFLQGERPDLVAVSLDTGVPGLRLVPGTSGSVGSANPPAARKQRLIRHVRALDAEVVVVDVGAGVAFNTLDLFDAADLRLVVVTPQLTSAQNAYAFLKGAVFRELRRIAAATGQQAHIDEASEAAAPTSSTAELLVRLSTLEPSLSTALQAGLAGFGARLIGNQLLEPRSANVVYALSRMVRDFLGLEVPVLGTLRASRRIHDSVNEGRPYLLGPGVEDADAAATLRAIARTLLDSPLPRDAAAASAPDPDLAPPLASPPAVSLPVAVSAYERSSERHPVDLAATLVFPGGLGPARLRDVSDSGALLELDRPPPPGTRATLVFTGFAEPPSLPCVIRHSDARTRRAGVEFLAGPDVTRRVAEVIRKLGSAGTGS